MKVSVVQKVRLTMCFNLTNLRQTIRSNLEYATTVWNPHYEILIKNIEKVQMRATKLVIPIKHLPYAERLKALKYRRFRAT